VLVEPPLARAVPAAEPRNQLAVSRRQRTQGGARRRLFTLFTGLSLVLCVVTAAAWVRSCAVSDQVAWQSEHAQTCVAIGRGLLMISHATAMPPQDPWPTWADWQTDSKPWKWFEIGLSETSGGYGRVFTLGRIVTLGFQASRSFGAERWALFLPLPLLFILTAVAPVLWWRRRSRSRPGVLIEPPLARIAPAGGSEPREGETNQHTSQRLTTSGGDPLIYATPTRPPRPRLALFALTASVSADAMLAANMTIVVFNPSWLSGLGFTVYAYSLMMWGLAVAGSITGAIAWVRHHRGKLEIAAITAATLWWVVVFALLRSA